GRARSRGGGSGSDEGCPSVRDRGRRAGAHGPQTRARRQLPLRRNMHHAVRSFAVAGTALLIASPSLAQTAPAACESPAFIPITDVGDIAAARARTLELI